MDDNIRKFLVNLDLNGSTDKKTLEETQKMMNFIFPADYQDFIKTYDGAEGPIGENSYFVLWSLQEVVELNKAYLATEYAPKLILIGDDGGDEAYAYDTRFENNPIVRVPFITMNYNDAIKCADTFNDFLKYLYYQG